MVPIVVLRALISSGFLHVILPYRKCWSQVSPLWVNEVPLHVLCAVDTACNQIPFSLIELSRLLDLMLTLAELNLPCKWSVRIVGRVLYKAQTHACVLMYSWISPTPSLNMQAPNPRTLLKTLYGDYSRLANAKCKVNTTRNNVDTPTAGSIPAVWSSENTPRLMSPATKGDAAIPNITRTHAFDDEHRKNTCGKGCIIKCAFAMASMPSTAIRVIVCPQSHQLCKG